MIFHSHVCLPDGIMVNDDQVLFMMSNALLIMVDQ